MPMPIAMAHALAKRLADVRKAGVIPYLRPDGKSQVTIEYEDGRPVQVDTVVISAQHAPNVDRDSLLEPDLKEHVIEPVLVEFGVEHEGWRPIINPTGTFEVGGPKADTGLTGRKIMVDSYGGMAPHGGGCFSGKDATEVFDFRPAAIIEALDLRRPIYGETACYGHFGRKGFPWEETDRAEDLRRALA